MKLFKLAMLLLAGAFTISSAAGQANASINILAQNTGIVNQGGTVYLQVTINNTGPVSSIGAYKVKTQISVPSAIASIPSNGHILPIGWTILSNDGSTIRLSNATDIIGVNEARTILIAIQGDSLGGPSAVAGQLSFSNGIAPGTGPGILPGDNTADNSSTSTIQVIPAPICNLAVSASAGAIACNGGTTTLTATATGAAGTVEYSLNGGDFQTSNTFTVDAAGSPYIVAVKDSSTCTAKADTVVVTQPTAIVASATAGTISCNGDSTTLTVTATGGTGAYQYSLNGGLFQPSNVFTVNAAGSPYVVSVSDANNCIASTDTVAVWEPTAISIIVVAADSGSITVSSTGGTGVKTYAIVSGPVINYTGDTTGVYTGLVAGTYIFMAIDSNGCKATSGPVELNFPPIVDIVTPVNTQTFLKGATVHLKASAADPDGSVAKVEYYNGNTLLTTVNTAPYSFDWRTDKLGNFSLTAKATDNIGAVTSSAPVSISVVRNQRPAISIISPVNNQTFVAPASIYFEASAIDPDGRIAQVTILNGSQVLTDMEHKLPYSYQWNNVPAGTYTITAVAKDNWSDLNTSAPITITVLSAVNGKSSLVNTKSALNAALTMKLSPNPVSNVLTISTEGLHKNTQSAISVISSSGVIMKTMQTSGAAQTLKMNVSSLSRGMYIIKMASGDKVIYKQFIKL